MSWWQTVRSWFTPQHTPLLAMNGRTLHWRPRAQLTVYIDRSADSWWEMTMDAMTEIEKAAGRDLWIGQPLTPTPELRAWFERDPLTDRWPRDCVLVAAELGASSTAHPGYCRHEYDPGSGLVNAARVYVPHELRVDVAKPLYPGIVMHELAHVWCVGHSPNPASLMAPVLRSTGQGLTSEDKRALRKAVGG